MTSAPRSRRSPPPPCDDAGVGVRDYLDYELFRLGSSPITVGTLLTCVLIFIGAALAARLIRGGARRTLIARGYPPGAASAASKMLYYSVVALGSFVALDTLGVSLTAVIAGSAVVLVGIGFGLQNIAQNFVSGLILLVERPVHEGDFIQVKDIRGTVQNIGLRATRVISRDEVTVIVPNSDLITAQVVNYSVPTNRMRITVTVGVAYETAPVTVRDALMGVAAACEGVLASPAPEVRLEKFGDSSLEFSLLCWIEEAREDLRTQSRLRLGIAAAFERAGIRVPYPQREVHLLDRRA
jgi:small-conductance mechanosensitive channel